MKNTLNRITSHEEHKNGQEEGETTVKISL